MPAFHHCAEESEISNFWGRFVGSPSGSFTLCLIGAIVWGSIVRQHHGEESAVKTAVHVTATRKQMTGRCVRAQYVLKDMSQVTFIPYIKLCFLKVTYHPTVPLSRDQAFNPRASGTHLRSIFVLLYVAVGNLITY